MHRAASHRHAGLCATLFATWCAMLCGACATTTPSTSANEGEGEADVNAPTLVTVLLIGNSQLGILPPDLAPALEDLARRANDGATTLVVDKSQIFGTGCGGFVSGVDQQGRHPLELAGSGNYDVVVFLPAIPETRAGSESCWEQFRTATQGAGSEFVLMATGNVSGNYPAGFTSLNSDFGSYAHDKGLRFIPAGDAWFRAMGDADADGRLEFYAGDDAHPGVDATYIYALALYAVLSERELDNVPNDLPALRCAQGSSLPCMTFAELAACVDANGSWSCDAPENHNGAFFDGRGKPALVTVDEAAAYVTAVEDALSAR